MRITKKLLRETKSGMSRRIRELVFLKPDEVLKEHQRCFPHLPDGQRPAFTEAQRWNLICDAIELALPSHWVD